METQRGTIKSDEAERKGKKGKRENEHREQKEKGQKNPGRERRDTHSERGRVREVGGEQGGRTRTGEYV